MYILKADRVSLDGGDDDGERVCISEPLENLKNFQLIYAHPEALVENKEVMKLLKTTEFQRRVPAIVVDEAHLVVEWYVNFIIMFLRFYSCGFPYSAAVLLDTSISCLISITFFGSAE